MNFDFSNPGNLFWLLLIISLVIIIFSFLRIISIRKIIPIILLRIVSIIILLLLFLDPRLTINKKNNRELNWNIYIDNSLSMAYHSNPSVITLRAGIENIVDKLENKNIPLDIFAFGSDIDTNWVNGEKEFIGGSTNIDNILNHARYNNNTLAGSIIFTDGQINQGPEINIADVNNLKPIHIVGVGDNNPLVDVYINSIDAPPVIIKGENANLEVAISSHGTNNEKLNVTLYEGFNLLGSKAIQVGGEGSIEKIRFMINPDKTGELEYRVQVNALPDEINIKNNKQVVPIQVLKNEYKIAMITGLPNFNTSIIKKLLSKNNKFKIDHYVFQKDSYSIPLNSFWDTKYDLILFDNHPVGTNAKDWESFRRIFAKKILSHKSNLAFFMGNDIHSNTFNSYLNLMDLSIKESLIELGSDHKWVLNKNWESIFPLEKINLVNSTFNDYPPLAIEMEIDSANARVLANFSISKVNIPLILVAEKSPLRCMIWSSPDLYKLYYKTQNSNYQDLTNQLLMPLFSWLMRTGNGKDFYFRASKNWYQQGEKVTITGKPVMENKEAKEGYIHIYRKGTKINTKPIIYDTKTNHYKGQFWASQSGKLDYEIELIYGDKSMIVSDGSVQIQESQIELNHVYLNKDPLVKLAGITEGSFQDWDNRISILSKVNNKSDNEITQLRIILHNSHWAFILILLLLAAEWILRRRNGMI